MPMKPILPFHVYLMTVSQHLLESVSCPDNGREGDENEVGYEESDRTNAIFENSYSVDNCLYVAARHCI